MLNSELAPISAQQASCPSEVIRRWLVIFGELYRQEITPALVEIWRRLLSDLEPEVLEEMCEQTAKTSKFFPTPADIQAPINQAEEAEFEVESEKAWDLALDCACRYYYADLGGMRGAPPLPEAVEFAVKAAGGWHRLHTCSHDELVWCRKTFLDRYKVLHKTGQAEHLLLTGDVRRSIHELTQSSRKRVAPTPDTLPDSSRSEQEQNDAPKAPSKTASKAPPQVATPKPVPYQLPSEEEIERRRQQQKQGLQDWLSARSNQLEKKNGSG